MVDDHEPHDEKLALILRSAAAIFAEKGYHQASIRDISRATGISLSGLYYYVRSKEEILFRIQEHAFATVLDNLQRLLQDGGSAEEKLRRLVENHLRFFVNDMQEMKVLSHEATALTGEARRRVNSLKRRYTDLCMELLRQIEPRKSPEDLRVATFALFGMMNWIYNWYRPGRDLQVQELAAEMTRIFLKGFPGESQPRDIVEGSTEPLPSIWQT
jgi:AcrR family transcriptional regulator